MVGWLAARAFALGGQPKTLQSVRVQSQLHRVVLLTPALFLGEVQILPIPVAHVVHGLGHVVLEHAVVLRIGFPLFGIGFAAQVLIAIFAAPAHQETDTRLRLKVDDEVRVARKFTPTLGCRESRKLQAPSQLDQHLLKRLALTHWRYHRHPY